MGLAASPPTDLFTHNSSLRSDFSSEERRRRCKNGSGGFAACSSLLSSLFPLHSSLISPLHSSLFFPRRSIPIMPPYKDYKELIVWQKSRLLVKAVYLQTKKLPRDEMFGLTNQVRRAVVSIPSNIAEGYNRHSDKEFIRARTR